jgi:hypothetical protein
MALRKSYNFRNLEILRFFGATTAALRHIKNSFPSTTDDSPKQPKTSMPPSCGSYKRDFRRLPQRKKLVGAVVLRKLVIPLLGE